MVMLLFLAAKKKPLLESSRGNFTCFVTARLDRLLCPDTRTLSK